MHYLMFNCETQIVVLGALKILYYQRRYGQTSAHTLTHEERGKKKQRRKKKKKKKEDNTQRILKL